MARVLSRPVDTRTVALGVAGLLAVGTGLLTFNYLAAVGHHAPALAQRTVLVAVKPIAAHQMITAGVLGTADKPATAVDPDALVVPASAIGHAAAGDIPAGSTITSSKLESFRAPGIAGLREGMRAVAIALDRVKGVSDLIRPGDRVDVIAITAPRQDEGPVAATIIRGARVLSVGQIVDNVVASAPQAPDANQYSTATLEVTPKQADLLALADINATLRLALRTPHEAIGSEPAEKLSFAVPPPRQAARPAPAPQALPQARQPQAPAAPKPRPTSPVLVITGDTAVHPAL